MRIFLHKLLAIGALTLVILLLSLFFIPDPVSNDNLLGALIDKHELLRQSTSPKIIFAGGSNVSFGLTSKRVSEAYAMPVVNMGVHAGIGLRYIVNDIKPFINSGDIFVLMPEYAHFTSDSFNGHIELVSILFDVYPEGRKLVSWDQWRHLLQYIPTYAASKLKNAPLLLKKKKQITEVGVYDRKAFNEYGDACRHWTLPSERIMPDRKPEPDEKVNQEVVAFLKDLNLFIKSKNATLVILPPVYQNTSFKNRQHLISEIDQALRKNDLPLAAEPARYKFEDDLFFNSSDHTNKQGVEKRTTLVIEDLAHIIKPDLQ